MVQRNPKHPLNQRATTAGALIIFLGFFLLKLPIITTPHHWDALYYVIPNGVWYAEHSFLSIAQPDFGHPPLLFWVLGATYRIFGYGVIVPHLVIIIFGGLALWYTYLLGTHLYGRRAGVLAAALLCFTPLFFAQAGILNIEVPLTALTIIVLYYGIKGDLRPFLPLGIALVLVKETGVFALIALAPYAYKKFGMKRLLVCLSPALALVAWLCYYFIRTGSIFYPSHVSYLSMTLTQPQNFVVKLMMFLKLLFISRYAFVLMLLILAAAAIALIKRKSVYHDREVPLIVLFVLYVLFYSFYDQSLSRHMLPVLPMIMLFGSSALSRLFKKYSYAVVSVLIILFITTWTGSRDAACGCVLEDNLEYLDLVWTHQQAASFIEVDYPDTTILTSWPQIVELTIPAAGYVKRPLAAYIPPNQHFAGLGYSVVHPGEHIDLVYTSLQSNSQLTAQLNQLVSLHNLTLVQRFERRGKSAEIYLAQ